MSASQPRTGSNARSDGLVPAVVCPVAGCTFAVTTEGTEAWPETIGLRVDGAHCPTHLGIPTVRGWVDGGTVWR